MRMDFLEKFQKFLGDRVPNVLIEILRITGFDSDVAVKLLNPERIEELESYLSSLNQHFDGSNYSPFKRLLPGHRSTLLALPSLVIEYELQTKKIQESKSSPQNDPEFTFIMKELIKTAKDNVNKDYRHRRFSQQLKDFGMYLYMMCGKLSYEILCNNIPLPQASTTCNSSS